MNLKSYSILFSISGITILYLLSMFCRPVSIDISEISKYEGKEVIVVGKVKDISETKYQSQIITLQNNNSTIKIFSEDKSILEYGDQIKVTGKVQKFEDIYEIVIENKKNIEILKKWDNITLPLSQLSLYPQNYLGLNLKVEGIIDNIFNSYFHLKDVNTSNTIIVSYNGGNDISLRSGQKVIVRGVFNFDSENFRYILSLYNKDHGINIKG